MSEPGVLFSCNNISKDCIRIGELLLNYKALKQLYPTALVHQNTKLIFIIISKWPIVITCAYILSTLILKNKFIILASTTASQHLLVQVGIAPDSKAYSYTQTKFLL